MNIQKFEIRKFLSSIRPFKEMERANLEQLVSMAGQKSFTKGETIFNEGEIADSVWVLYKGRIQIFKYTSLGKPLAIESLTPGEVFGTLCRLGDDGRFYPCTAVTAESTLAVRIPNQVFLNYYAKSPGLARGVCALCAARLKEVQDIRRMGQEPVPIRAAALLLNLYKVHGNTIPFTKREISEMMGVALETAFRALSAFQKNEWLASFRGKILIKNPRMLKTFVEKDSDYLSL